MEPIPIVRATWLILINERKQAAKVLFKIRLQPTFLKRYTYAYTDLSKNG